MAHIIAFANHKGGVGKTTSVATIGAALALRGLEVLLIDLDSQANLTYSMTGTDEHPESVFDALTGHSRIPIVSVKKGLDISPASIDLARADLGGGLLKEGSLKGVLESVTDRYNFILIDCPPSLGILTTNALAAATEIYVPLTAEALPLKGLTMLEEVIAAIAARTGGGQKVSGIFLTRYNRRKLNSAISERISQLYGGRMFGTRIRECIALAEAPLSGSDIFDYSPESAGAKDYSQLSDEILRRTAGRR